MTDERDAFECGVCGKRFESREALEDHQKSIGLVY